jgi:hypothetical protein
VRHATHLGAAHSEVHPEALEVDHDEEHEHRREEVREVRGVRAVEGLLQRADLVRARDEEFISMECRW